ncbi:MAG: tetratricopeptide repeat protein [Candidatus Peribacteraceae bacterium]|jgi:tetratricopeptide (TPR) repeat protein|nr:tetratricopeptide repeat protein [Candidatus Peribacteraceae bacterium]MDP7477459.1 tetratricopeptide repeat protein [Candidatus Peribacteraceae bacterium]
MIYILVLFTSFFAICAILGLRIALNNRNVRKFVHGVKARTEKARERGLTMRETRVDKPTKSPRASAIDMQKLRSLLREAEKTSARGRYEESEKSLIQALTISPGAIEVRAELAKLYLLMDRDVKAEALYRDLVSEISDVSFYANLGLSCYKQGRYEYACEAYQEAMLLDPKNPERSASFGRACIAAKRFSDAAELLEHATERLARDTVLLHMLAECYESLGHLNDAEDTYRKIHKLQPYDERVKEKLSAFTCDL